LKPGPVSWRSRWSDRFRSHAPPRHLRGWPTRFAPQRAATMGFTADGGMEEIIEAFITDELGGTYVA
jgi:hypothetical protein